MDASGMQASDVSMPVMIDPDSDYQLAGAAIQPGLEKTCRLDRRWGLTFEGKLSHASADIQPGDGSIEIPGTAVHIVGGVRYGLFRYGL